MSLHVYISLINYRALGGRVGPVGFRSEDRSQRRQMFEPSNRGTLFGLKIKQQFTRMCGCCAVVKLVVFLILVFVCGPRIHQLIVAAALGYYVCK